MKYSTYCAYAEIYKFSLCGTEELFLEVLKGGGCKCMFLNLKIFKSARYLARKVSLEHQQIEKMYER